MATVITSRSESVLHYLNPIAMTRNLWQHRDLIRQFTKREIEGRYKGSSLGLLWSFINPLVLLLIYTFVFGIVLKSRWPQARTGSLGEFAIVLFCGLIAFNVFSECVSRASNLVISVPNYVKKVVFPLEILPISTLGAALFHGFISLAILLCANLIINHEIKWTLLLLPVVSLPLLFLSLGLMWFLSSLGVFIRDIGYTVALVLQVLFFLTPIFYPIENIPQPFNNIVRLNPLASIVDNFRRAILWGTFPSPIGWTLWTIATGLVMFLGYAWFMKTKKAFADVV